MPWGANLGILWAEPLAKWRRVMSFGHMLRIDALLLKRSFNSEYKALYNRTNEEKTFRSSDKAFPTKLFI